MALLPSITVAQSADSEEEESESLPVLAVTESRVANPDPAGTFPTAITELRYEPLIDVQTRNIAEAQGDVSIRGGIFENTGFRVGAATLFDPQTGHYFAEIPIDQRMLSGPTIATGLENAYSGFNSTVGSVNYAWRPIESVVEMDAGVGDNDFLMHRTYIGRVIELDGKGHDAAADFSISQSRSDGTRPGGDHHSVRYAARLQLQREGSQTDLFAGYQSKFFGWPNMYTPFNVLETENLQTRLFLINHRTDFSDDSYLEVTSYYRRHKDDYEFSRSSPGLFNPFQHQTIVGAAGFQGRQLVGGLAFNYSGQFVTDEITSSNLVFAPFDSRNYFKVAIVPEWRCPHHDGGEVTLRMGASYDDTNRENSRVSPMASVSFSRFDRNGRGRNLYFQYAESSQVAGYTAIGANPDRGLFRGKPNAVREGARNYEAGVDLIRPNWRGRFALFYRLDCDLLDWTFRFDSSSARTANQVDIDTFGGELTYFATWEDLTLILGYSYLSKNEDYGSAEVDASFYALNYPRHRLTAAFIYRFLDTFELRMDNEFRSQEENPLRRSSDQAVRTSLSLIWDPPMSEVMDLRLVVDNLFDSDFEEIPATPAVGRQVSAFLNYRW